MSPARASAALRDAIFRARGIEIFAAPEPCAHCPTCGSALLAHSAIRQIQRAVANHYDLPEEAMVSQRRGRAVAHPRQVAMFLARELTPKSLPDIGRRFGGRDHTTVMHAIRAVKARMAASPDYATEVAHIKEAAFA